MRRSPPFLHSTHPGHSHLTATTVRKSQLTSSLRNLTRRTPRRSPGDFGGDLIPGPYKIDCGRPSSPFSPGVALAGRTLPWLDSSGRVECLKRCEFW